MRRLIYALAVISALLPCAAGGDDIARQKAEARIPPSLLGRFPNAEDAIYSKTDYWGDLAMRKPNGPSYEFFASLLPPLRYVDAPFHHYPITLSAPSNPAKARYISNGSAINALARQVNWHGETGNPVSFYVGEEGEVYGSNLRNLDGPHYLKGYLPIIQNWYRHDDSIFGQEVFCGADSPYAENAAVFVRVTGKGKVVAQLSMTADSPTWAKDGVIRDASGGALLWFDENWKWEPGAQRLVAALTSKRPALLAVFTQPMKSPLPKLSDSIYDAERGKCIAVWQDLLNKGMQVETPEPVVNNAWRALLVGTFEVVSGDEMRYSVGNQYAHLYISEGGDALRGVLLWGYPQDARRMLNPLMDYKREGLLYNQAGKKLYFLAHYYQLTCDADWFRENRGRWLLQANRLINDREPGNGLLPRERYCGDIETPVYSLNVNSNAWGSLRDFSVVLDEIGEHEMALKCAKAAEELKPATLAAVEKSERKDVNPPFEPMAFFGEEKPYDPMSDTRMGGYWDLIAPYVLGSGIFAGTEREDWIMQYLQRKGGLCMGMVRTHPSSSFWIVHQNNDDLYTLRYVLTLLRRDEVDRALVSFYGKLAQGFTRDTFIGAEGTSQMPLDQFGRQMYLPPNSASNAFWLWMLRYVLVQDWDLNNDGRPDTLRLMFATPRRWLEDGKRISIQRAPTAFGEVSVTMEAHFKKGEKKGEIVANVGAPPRSPGKMLLRARVPDGWKVVSAKVGNRKLRVDSRGTVDITGMTGTFVVRFAVHR